MLRWLRTLHLYLGCIFGPLLLFFAVSGIWQTLKLHLAPEGPGALAVLSTIHTSRALKSQHGVATLSSPLLEVLVIAMSVGLVVTAVVGVVMAIRWGRSRRAVWLALGVGVLLPLVLVGAAGRG